MIKFDEFYYGSFDGSQEQRGVIDISYNLTAGQQKGGTPSINVLISGVSPLALLNAVKLNYVKAFGKCEQRSVLPEGYTQLEYIESTGTQYIDINVSGNVTFIGTAQSTTDSSTTSQVIVANSGASAGHWFGVQSPGAGSPYAKRWGLGATPTASSTINGTTKIDFSITFMQTTQSGTVNDQTLTRESSAITHTDWIIFAGNTTPSYGFIGKVWKLKVVQNDVLVRNLIPAKNSSNIIGMYDLVSGQFFRNSGTGNFIEGGKATPSPDNVMPIWCNNGAIKVSPNLFNINDIYGDYLLTDTGQVGNASVAFFLSTFIRVKPSTTYTFSFISGLDSQYRRVCGYSSADQDTFTQLLIKKGRPTTVDEQYDLTFTTNTNTNYIRISTVIKDTNMQVVEGSTSPATYMPYGSIYYDGDVETVTVKPNERENHFVQYINAYLRTSTRSITAYSGNSVVTFDCEVGKTYCCINRAMGGNSTSVNVGYSDTIPTTGYVYSESDFEATIIVDGDYKTTGLVFTAKKRYVTFIFRYDNDSSKTPTSMLEQMIFYETTKAQSATCQPLLSVGTYKDMQNITNGAITRNVGIKVLDGVTTGAKATSVNINTGKYYAVCGGQTNITATTTDLLSTHFKAGAFASGYDIVYSIATNIVLVNSNQSLTTVDSYNQWLASQYAAGTPVIIVYPLANPTTETVTGQTLTIAQGTNIVTATGSVDDLELEISYKGYAELTVEEIEAVNTDESVDVTIS